MEDQQLIEAYKVLDLPPGAEREEVEKRYFLLLKKSKTERQTAAAPQIDVELISRAYKTINNYELQQKAQKFEEQTYAGSKSKRWIDNIWHLYKLQIVAALVILIMGGMMLNSYLDKRAEKIALANLPPADLEVMFVGEYFHPDRVDLGSALLTVKPEWQRIQAMLSYNPENPRDEFDIAAVQKNILNLMYEEPDLYIVDQYNFKLLVDQGFFMKLDDWQLDIEDNRKVVVQGKEDTQPHMYGIDVSDSMLFKQLSVNQELVGKEEKIVALRYDASELDKAAEFIQALITAR